MTEHLSMDPVYGTNWCDMPSELKLVCIGKMGFRERLSLRRTSKAEKSLVDSQKIEFQSGAFGLNRFQINPFGRDGWRKPAVGHYDLDEILAISQIQNAPSWHIKDCSQEDCLHKVAQMWINENSKIGSTFQVSTLCNIYSESRLDFLRPFVKYFTDRIVSQTEKRVRIRTNNPDRHILLERGLDERYKISNDQKYFRMMVISSEMKESEYDDNCKEWILSLDCEAYD
ncbi:unnamed protein product [Caenorhabditis nigoni]